VYLWTGSAATTDPNFYNIGLTYISGSGVLQKNKDYLISLLTYDIAGQTGDKNFLFTQNNPLATWVVTHNLDKYPSASVVTGVNDELIYGNVTYQSTNKLTITFSSPVSGKAFIN
jgi:hypothetical protein